MSRRSPFSRAALALACAAVVVGCTEDARSPVGVDILPGGILEDGLESIAATEFATAVDYEIFPSRRAEGDRLPSALAWPEPPGIESRPIFRFVVASSDPVIQESEILESTLRLVYSIETAPEIPVEIDVHRVTSEWSEEAATWERRLLGARWGTPGGDFDPVPIATFTVEPAPAEPDSATQADTLTVDLPNDLVLAWREESIENHGLILIQRTAGQEIEFASRADGTNPNGPTLLVSERLPGEEGAIQLRTLLAREDTFLPHDAAPLPADPGLMVAVGDPTRRIFLQPTLADVPVGSTVASARLVLTVDAAAIPDDTLRVAALEAESEFIGEKTVFDPLNPSTVLAVTPIPGDVAPGDTVVFAGSSLTRLVRAWLRNPDAIDGLGLISTEEGSGFGAVRFHGPEAAPALRPRLQLLILPAQTGAGR